MPEASFTNVEIIGIIVKKQKAEYMFTDTHTHYDDAQFAPDRDALLNRIHAEDGVDYIIIPGCDPESTKRALDLADKYDFIYAAAGIHPEEISKFSPEAFDEIVKAVKSKKCVAVGEIGLDYYWDASEKEKQKEIFRMQLKLASEADKPVIIHDREAHGDSFETVCAFPGLRGVFHCYSGSAEMAKELLKRGWYLGFDGPVTYKNARKTVEVLEICPTDRILLETDSPYLSPVPMRGKRNDSSNLKYIAAKIAEIKGIDYEALCRITSENAKNLFGI